MAVLAFLAVIGPNLCSGGEWSGLSRAIVGFLEDASGKRLAYAHVSVPGTTYGTFSDEDGVFRLRLPGRDSDTLYVNLIGYRDTTVAIGELAPTDTFLIVLRPRWNPRGDRALAAKIAEEIIAASDIDVFVVRGGWDADDATPNFRHCAIVASNMSPDTSAVRRLCNALLNSFA